MTSTEKPAEHITRELLQEAAQAAGETLLVNQAAHKDVANVINADGVEICVFAEDESLRHKTTLRVLNALARASQTCEKCVNFTLEPSRIIEGLGWCDHHDQYRASDDFCKTWDDKKL